MRRSDPEPTGAARAVNQLASMRRRKQRALGPRTYDVCINRRLERSSVIVVDLL